MRHRENAQDQAIATAPAPWMVAVVRAMKPVVRPVACRAIVGRNRSRTDPTAGRFTRSQVSRIVNRGFERFEHQVPDLPSEPTLGSRQNVLLAALTLSFLEALEADGIERGYAIELTADVCWRVYRQWGNATRAATRLITCDPVRRLRLSVNAFLTFPFGRPGYRFTDVPQPDGRSLDMQRCPVADYLGSRGAADLCAGSWCNLDYALAEMWGGTLERSTTLVTGGSCCDFRFRTPGNLDAPPAATVGRPLPMVAA
jgi:L-2-amino-thiazoline-4-carboxylic acid hydrolase